MNCAGVHRIHSTWFDAGWLGARSTVVSNVLRPWRNFMEESFPTSSKVIKAGACLAPVGSGCQIKVGPPANRRAS